jgi:hypothetical protein
MTTNTISPFEDDNDGRHASDGGACHQLGEEKVDGTALTVPSVEGNRVEENQPVSAENDTTGEELVTPKMGDIFDDLAALGRPIDEIIASEKLLTSLPVRKPKRDEWIRIHMEISARVHIYEARDENTFYIVLPGVVEPLQDVVRYVQLSLAVNYSGGVFVWPVTVPTERKPHRAHITAFAAVEKAAREWIRISWGKDEYDVYRRSSAKIEPAWPEEITNASEMLRFAAKAGGIEIIDSLDHPVVRAFQGRD